MRLYKLNAAGVELIKRYEGLRLAAYLCEAGVPTIGYGHTEGVRLGMRISEHQADVILAHDLEHYAAGVSELLRGVEVNENEFAALVSFAFNVGLDQDADTKAEGLGDSSLLRKLHAGDRAGAADEFRKWVNAGGKRSAGLVKRREEERALFLKAVQP